VEDASNDGQQPVPQADSTTLPRTGLPTLANQLVGYLADRGVLALTPVTDMRYWVTLIEWSATSAVGVYADATARRRAQDWARFVAWCARWQRQPLPADATTVRLYILAHIRYLARVQLPPDLVGFIDHIETELAQAGVERAEKPLKIASLARYVNSIAEAHRRAEAPDPTVQGPAHDALRLARRVSDGEQQQRDPIQHHHLDAMLALPCVTPREQQDVLLVAMAYETGQRVGAVAQIAVEDVTYAPDGGAEVKIFRHKTTQQNKPIRKQISPALVARLQAWLALTGIDAGPVFRPLAGRRNQLKNLPPTALSTNAIRAAMKRCMARIGVADLGLIGGHSTRIGGALDLMEHGCTLDELMRHGNWHGTAMPLRYTQRHTDAVNPIHRILSGSKPIDSAGEA